MLRATIVLWAADRCPSAAIARALRVSVETVRKWRGRWNSAPGVASLGDAKRSGRPPKFTPVQVTRVKAMACTPPKECGVPLARWSCPELARHAVTDGICASISQATIRRWLSQDALKPWQHQSWIFISDPNFATKASRVLDLYARVWDGEPLGEHDYVISSDEKTSIQARCHLDYLIVSDAGRGKSVTESSNYFHKRLKRSFDITYEKSQDGGRSRLHEVGSSGQVRGIVHSYLAQRDDKLPVHLADLVPRSAVINYGTNFKKVSPEDLAAITIRGEQLTRVLLAHYCPELGI
ncbi:helix-turn-helix domain-containing protein [Rhodococcus opacus]|uniref:helix-turn-helix domain-containing protein n=1 Tax=Rhodococcus opacus TaxID=37919 RepID=UPI0006BB463F|nr:helix-turn-helix domain-containing protein [Rhodococcus opacus]MDJ0415387.1 helix-turn-helix domain-containing protein [Rhodococcus opacus]UNN05120.1 helix-turn-helix domain-containing protein [Rhodococcus opacus]WKN52693.1 helix-turn-helix domain-containing protein [Rhodococcus opacus]